MKKKIVSMIIVSVLLIQAFGLMGCSSQGTKSADESKSKNDVVELRFMDVIPNPEREKTFLALVDEFNKQNPDVKVIYESTPWDQAHNKMVTLGSAESLPDVFIMHQQWNAEFTSAKWVADLDDYIAKWDNADKLLPYVKNVLMDYDQKNVYGYNFGIPDGLTTAGMFVRTDWVEEAGLKLENLKTWKGIFDASAKMTDKEKNQYGFAFRGARMGSEQMGMYLLSQIGGKLYEEDGTCRINTPEGLKAFKEYCDLYLKGYSPQDSINWGYAEMVQGFTTGLSGILNQTTEVVATCKDSMKDGTWTVLPFPRAEDGNIYSKADSFYMAMADSGKHKEESWRFIEFMLDPENNRTVCETNLYIPVMQGAESDPRFTEGGMAGFVESMNDSKFIREPFYGYFPELAEFMETVYDTEVQKYLLGQQTAEESVKNISDYLTKAQQNYMTTNPDVPVPASVRVDGSEVK